MSNSPLFNADKLAQNANEVPYTNTTSGMAATDVQAAIDEAEGRLDTAESKLAGIEAGATADQTGAEIKSAYEGEADTNAFTDAEQTKLAGIETGATKVQTTIGSVVPSDVTGDDNDFHHISVQDPSLEFLPHTYLQQFDTSPPVTGGPYDLAFSSDGTQMYVMSEGLDQIVQFTLSTGWDVSTASDSTKRLDANPETVDPTGFTMSTDGTKVYVYDSGTDVVFQYTIGTPFDLATSSYSGISKTSIVADHLAISNDGTKLYAVDEGVGNTTIVEYTLSTPFNVSTATAGTVFDTGNTAIAAIYLRPDGTGFYLTNRTDDNVRFFRMSTALDISTAVADPLVLDILPESNSPIGIALKDDFTKLYIISNLNDRVQEWDVSPQVANPGEIYEKVSGSWTLKGTVDSFTSAEKTKLAGIETAATADQTGAEIKVAYEAEADTNAFTDAEQSKLGGIEAGATAEVSATTSVEGIVELATQAEVDAGTDPNRVVTAQTLTNFSGLGGGGGTAWTMTFAQSGALTTGDMWMADASAGNVTRDLPAAPATDDEVIVKDDTGSALTNTITIGRNGNTINGSATDLVLDVLNGVVRLKYNGSGDWRLI